MIQAHVDCVRRHKLCLAQDIWRLNKKGFKIRKYTRNLEQTIDRQVSSSGHASLDGPAHTVEGDEKRKK